MKVLHILDRSTPNVSGYSIRSQNIVEAQQKIGITPIVLTSMRQKESVAAIEKINNIEYHRSVRRKFHLRLPLIDQLFEVHLLANKIQELVEKEGIDLLHAHSPLLCGLAALRVANKTKLPLVYEIRAFWEDAAVSSHKCKTNSARYKLTRLLETYLCARVNKVVTISDGLKSDLIARGLNPAKISTIPNGIDMQSFHPQPKSTELLEKYHLNGDLVLGFIGSFFQFEGIDLLVALMSKLHHKSVKMLLVGEGESYSNIKKMITAAGLTHKIILTGKVPSQQIMEFYSIIDIFIYPRKSERITELVTPLKPLEALAMKKNVVISDVGGLRELIPANLCISFKASDVHDLHAKVENLVSNFELRQRLIEQSYQYIQGRDWTHIVSEYQKIYNIKAGGLS